MTRVLFDSRWIAPHGIGRVAKEYRDRLAKDFDVVDIAATAKPSLPTDFATLAMAFRKSEADVLFSPGYNGTPLAGRRQVFIIHDLIHFDKAEPGGWKKRLYYKTVIRSAARLGTVLTVSQASADEIGRRWPETRGNVRVVPNGLAQPFLPTHVDGDRAARRGLVLFANGRWHKNLPGMLAGIARWQAGGGAGSDEPVTLVGAPEPVAATVASSHVQNVTFAGRIDDEDLATLLRRSRALLFCSFIEGFGLPLVEALACNCAVVASDIPVFREIADAGCVFVDPAQPVLIAAGIAQARDAAMPPALASQIAAQFDWERSYALVASAVEAAARR